MSLSLQQWLTQLEQGMVGGVIDLGLERSRAVKERLNLAPKMPAYHCWWHQWQRLGVCFFNPNVRTGRLQSGYINQPTFAALQ